MFNLADCDQKEAEPNPSVVAGEMLFQDNCAGCQPRTGRGHYLGKAPVTLLIKRNQYELMAWIQGSDWHREMPSFDYMTDEERAALADYLHDQITK